MILMCEISLLQLGKWFENVFGHVQKIPRYLIPRYFDAVVTGVYQVMEEVAWMKMSEYVTQITSIQHVSSICMISLYG